MGKALIGRDLPEITRDFTESGLDLDHMYATLPIPLDLLPSQARLRQSIEKALEAAYTAYGKPLPKDAVESAGIDDFYQILYRLWITRRRTADGSPRKDHLGCPLEVLEPIQAHVFDEILAVN